MGLDTVELAMSFEHYFGLEISDAVSKKLYTVGDVAVWFSQQLGVAGQLQSAVRATVAEHLLSELPSGVAEDAPLRQLLPDAQSLKRYSYALRNRYGLILPPLSTLPVLPASPSLWERLTGQQLPRVPHWHTQTLAALVDWTIAFNYEKLLLPPFISQYEIEQVVIGLTSDKSGVPVEEIRLTSSFTDDLGMD
jgi:acyl carrier protein